MRMIISHWTTTSTLAKASDQRKLMGIDLEYAAKHRARAVDLLGEEFQKINLQIPRSADGLGVVMDATVNGVAGLEKGGSGRAAGLKVGDIIAVVDGSVITAIEGGYITPRELTTTAIDPTKNVVSMTVFRRKA